MERYFATHDDKVEVMVVEEEEETLSQSLRKTSDGASPRATASKRRGSISVAKVQVLGGSPTRVHPLPAQTEISVDEPRSVGAPVLRTLDEPRKRMSIAASPSDAPVAIKKRPSMFNAAAPAPVEEDLLEGIDFPPLVLGDSGNSLDDESAAAAMVLLDFLAAHKNTIDTSETRIAEFEALTHSVLSRFPYRRTKLYQVLLTEGWSDSGFQHSLFRKIDEDTLNLALGTFYLNCMAEKRAQFRSLSKKGLTQGFLSEADSIKSFCPSILLNSLEKRLDGTPMTACSVPFLAACMIADISGFTKLSSTFSAKGSAGLDELHQHTNGFLGHFVQIVYQHGGDVISFAGDALVCIFEVGNEQSSTRASVRALRCALELKDHYTETLTAHIAVSYGEMSFSTLGGHNGEWTYLLNGPCISELSSCLDDSGSREICTTETFYQSVIAQLAPDERLMAYPNKNKNRLVKKLKSASAARELVPRLNQFSSSAPLLSLARLFVPRPALDAIEVGTFSSLAELREVTTLFLKLDTYSPTEHADPVTLQPLFLILQEKLHEQGGFMRQFLLDDKGCVFIGMWGVPSLAYTNNCSRALLCAASIVEGVHRIGHHVSIGITTGSVFCGNIGSEMRRDFVGIGATVNLAARFMSKAEGCILLDELSYNRIPDKSKQNLARSYGMVLKGVTGKVKPYVFVGTLEALARSAVEDERKNSALVMRKPLIAAYKVVMDALAKEDIAKSDVIAVNTNRTSFYRHKSIMLLQQQASFPARPYNMLLHLVGMDAADKGVRHNADNADASDVLPLANCVFIEGLPGMGRNTAVKFFKEVAQTQQNVKTVSVAVRQGDDMVQLGVIKKLFVSIVGSDILEDVDLQHRKLKELLLNACPVYDQLAEHVINSLVDELRRHLGKTRVRGDEIEIGKNVDQLPQIIRVMRHVLSLHPTAVTVENLHFADSLSWLCLQRILRTNLRAAVVISVQSGYAESGDSAIKTFKSTDLSDIGGCSSIYEIMETIKSNPRCEYVKLDSMNEEEVREILLERIKNKSAVTSELVEMVLEASSGNPYWCESIAQYIDERGDRDFVLAMKSGSNGSASNALSVLVISKLELLKQEEQLIVKFASAIGEDFSEVLLDAIIPERFRANLKIHLSNLVAFGFLKLSSGLHNTDVLSFQNSRIRTIIYEMLPAREAAKTHLEVAKYIESTEQDLRPFYVMLSHHYAKSKARMANAFKYSVKASDLFILGRYYAEGLVHLEKSLEIITKKDITTDQREFEDVSEHVFHRVFEVIDCALMDMSDNSVNLKAYKRFLFRSLNRRNPDSVYQGYLDLQLEAEKGLKEYMDDRKRLNSSSKKRKQLDESLSGPRDDKTLSWRASYTNAKGTLKLKPKPQRKTNCIVS